MLQSMWKNEMNNLHIDSLKLAEELASKIINKQPVDLLDVLELTSHVKSAYDTSEIDFNEHEKQLERR